MRFLRIAAVPVILIITAVPAFVSAPAQAKPSTAPAATPVHLQTYTLPDKSASAGVPAGWKAKGGASGMIAMSGPQGENITLGQIILAHDGPFHVGQKGPEGAVITMPASAKLSNKLLMIFEQTAAASGESAPQIKFLYGTLLQVPASMGQCGVFVVSNGTTRVNAMGIFCSLPDDSGQFFKNILIIGSAPVAVAAQTEPIVLAVFKSYTIAPGWTQKILSPFMSPAAGGPSTQYGVDSYTSLLLQQHAIDVGAQCVDAGLVGPSSYHQAAECGYLSPDF
ncbi:MAG: hypothetical protein P4K78_09815 [Terracidiphilus sp.]|nr:hypothetical protein [Terracidiphilus sp.]